MANVSPIAMKNNTKLSINKVSAKNNSVKAVELKNYNVNDDEKIDYNKKISDLSIDNNIGSIGDINLDGKVDAYDEKKLQEYLNLDSSDRLVYATEHSHMFETSRLLEKYKNNPNLNEIINLAYNGEAYPEIEQTADGSYGDKNLSESQKQENEKIINEFREAFTQDELTVGESGIDNFMSIINGKSIYYDINGDGKTDLNDVTTLQKYNQIMNDYKNDKNPKIDPKINTSGNFSDLTDYQNMMLTAIDYVQYLAINGFNVKNLEGQTINKCIDIFKENNDSSDETIGYTRLDSLKTLVDNGFGDYKIVEVVQDGSFDAVVLQDPNGNYRIFYNSTKYYGKYNHDIRDYLYDARNVFEEQFVNGWVDSMIKNIINSTGSIGGKLLNVFLGPSIGYTGSLLVTNVLSVMYEKLIDIIRNGLNPDSSEDSYILDFLDTQLSNSGMDESMKNQIINAIKNGGLNGEYEDQQNKAKALADKYYDKVVRENEKRKNIKSNKDEIKEVKLSLQGYSLSASLTEAAYLSLCDKEGANDVVDGVVIYNPNHDNLTKEEAEKVKNAKGFKLYYAEGDMVSTTFNYNEFKDVAKYLYMDYDTLLKEQVSKEGESNLSKEGFEFDQLANFEKIFGYTHSNQPYLFNEYNKTQNRKAFAEDGSVRKNVEGYDVHGHRFENLSKYLFGGEEISNIDDLGKAIFSSVISQKFGVNSTKDDL